MNLCRVCHFENRLEANALLTNVAHLVLLGGVANITQRSHILLREANLQQSLRACADAIL